MPSIIYEDVFANKIQDLNIIIDEAKIESVSCNNIERRRLHSLVELLRLDIEDWFVTTESKVEEIALAAESSRNIRVNELHAKLDLLVNRLCLIPLKRSEHWWKIFDTCFRFISVCVCIITVGIFCSLPLMFLQLLDSILGIDPYYQIAEKMKRSIAWLLLLVSGISVDIVGASHRKHFESSCVLLTFSHASNLDGFLVSGTCPVKHVALAKKELFVVPFFSWISLAFGGMPVDRNNRDRAVQALKRTTDSAKNNKVCIVVAPEGTRSTSGQLLPFKKGTFHMWEQLQAPIVPLIIYGAYDLYPVGSWVNNTGRVAVRYLPPILPTEAKSRDEMLRIVSFKNYNLFILNIIFN
jgi:1-acyl-sn-glycerol-3-phosphate acyltransferase